MTLTLEAQLSLHSLFRKELELCGIGPGGRVATYSEGGARRDYAEIFAAAAKELGASAFSISMPGLPRDHMEIAGRTKNRPLEQSPELVEALKACDLVIDLCPIMGEPESIDILAAGTTRMLTCVEPPATLARLFPTEEERRRAIKGRELLSTTSEIRITSDAGTDCVFRLGQFPAGCQYGIADTPGRWDMFAGSMVAMFANENEVNGTIVVSPGDVMLPTVMYVHEPVTFTIVDGYITAIDGGREAAVVREMMSRYDRQAYGISHIGWGLSPGALWESLTIDPTQLGMDQRVRAGSVMWSTGPNMWLGGNNTSRCHWDIPMLNTSLWADDHHIVDRGRLVEGSAAIA